MKLKQITKGAMVFALSASFLIPQIPKTAIARGIRPEPVDLFPIDNEDDDTGLTPPGGDPGPFIPSTDGNNNNGGFNPGQGQGPGGIGRPGNNNNNNNNNNGRGQNRGRVTMFPAKVPDEFSCSIFDTTNSVLFSALDALTKGINSFPGGECSGNGTQGETLKNSVVKIQNSIDNLKKLTLVQDPSSIQANQIDQPVSDAITALTTIGSIIENNDFLESDCGKHTLSSGQLLLAINEAINGLAPFALQAVAAAPAALPYVIAGSAATSAISTVAKLYDQNTLKMDNPEHRKALLQNTCQYMKIAVKENLMKLALDGKADFVKAQLEKQKTTYLERYSVLSKDLSGPLSSREKVNQMVQNVTQTLQRDQKELSSQNTLVNSNADDDMVCIISKNMVDSSGTEGNLPASIMSNLENALKLDGSQANNAKILKAHGNAKIKNIKQIPSTNTQGCAKEGRSLLNTLQQALTVTNDSLNKVRADMDKKLFSEKKYSALLAQFQKAQTINRFEKALDELMTKSNYIDLSELSQRMKNVKAGLFGTRPKSNFTAIMRSGSPPVLAWIDQIKEQYKNALVKLDAELKAIHDDAYKHTQAAKYNKLTVAYTGLEKESELSAQYLDNLNVANFPHEEESREMCNKLAAAAADWHEANYHLGAIELFCNMISPALDTSVDPRIKTECNVELQKKKNEFNIQGYLTQAALIKRGQKNLACPGAVD
ncbi:MAG: hypothetical protein ACXVCP_19330 [Bdellovibrio sp.]